VVSNGWRVSLCGDLRLQALVHTDPHTEHDRLAGALSKCYSVPDRVALTDAVAFRIAHAFTDKYPIPELLPKPIPDVFS
jgi:hypothetical protein